MTRNPDPEPLNPKAEFGGVRVLSSESEALINPSTLPPDPKPCTLYLKSYTLNLSLYTINPTPEPRNPAMQNSPNPVPWAWLQAKGAAEGRVHSASHLGSEGCRALGFGVQGFKIWGLGFTGSRRV